MNKKLRKLARAAGFCFWTDEKWKPEDAIIDWSSKYDKEMIKYTKLLLEDVAKRNNLNVEQLMRTYKL